MRIVYAAIIECAPAQLWPWLEDPERQKRWMPGLLDNEPTTPGPARVGSTFVMTIQEGRRVISFTGEITNYAPYRHLGLRLWTGARQEIEIATDYKMQDLGSRTRLDYTATVDVTTAGLFVRSLAPAFRLIGTARLRRSMKILKQLAEIEAHTPVAA